jgi:anti-anti-sigma factor
MTPGVVVFAVHGEVDSYTSPQLRDRLLDHLRPTCRQLVVDLTEVSFFAAAGLTVLVIVREAATAAGVRLFLVADTPVVLRPLMITGLDDVFDIYPDIEHVQMHLGAVAGQIVGGSLDDHGALPMPRAEPSTPCLT